MGAQMMSPDGARFLMTWNEKGDPGPLMNAPLKIGMWNVNTGEQLWEITSPSSLLGFSPDGKTFLTLDGLHRSTGAQPNMHFTIYNSDSGEAMLTRDLLVAPAAGH